MTITRVTQNMMMERSYSSLQSGLARLSKTQEQLSTGRVLNRPSDSPTDTTSAMRLRGSIAEQTQFTRNSEDGLGWLGQIDSTLTGMLSQVNRAKELGLQSVNGANQSPAAREAMATEIDQIRENLIGQANTTYLGRPVFGGLVNATTAYDANGAFTGVPGQVQRAVATGVKVQVNVDGPDAFGVNGDNLFDHLETLANDIRAGNNAGVQTGLGNLSTDHQRITATLSDVGTRYNRLDRASQAAQDSVLSLTAALSELENVDLARATLDLGMHEVAYQAALSATARLVQPSLSDFLR